MHIFKEKRTMPRISVSLLMLLLILPTSCKKDDPMEPCNACNHDTSFEGMIEWCFFQSGTWCVYEEIGSEDRDSVYVTEAFIDHDSEAFEFTAFSEYEQYNLVYRHTPDWVGSSNVSPCSVRRLQRGKFVTGDVVGVGLVANFPPIVGDWSGDFSGEFYSAVRTQQIDSNYVFEGVDYGLTTLFTIGHANSEDGDSLVLRISKNIGIIYKELPEQEKYWKIVEHNIVQ